MRRWDLGPSFEVQGGPLEPRESPQNILGADIFICLSIMAMCRYSWPIRTHCKAPGVRRICDGGIWGRVLEALWSPGGSPEYSWSGYFYLFIDSGHVSIFLAHQNPPRGTRSP